MGKTELIPRLGVDGWDSVKKTWGRQLMKFGHGMDMK